MSRKNDNAVVERLKAKASRSMCTYKVSAVAFDRKGNILGTTVNRHSKWNVVDHDGIGRAGTAVHAERLLMSRYGRNIKTILICRIGLSGELRPIDPCQTCSAVAEKLGIQIMTVSAKRTSNQRKA